MKVCLTGNPNKGLASALRKIYPEATFFSRSTGYDLSTKRDRERVAEEACQHDVFINNSALHNFNQTLILQEVFSKCIEWNAETHVINVGSTIDRVTGGKVWLYGTEKRALRDMSNDISHSSVWSSLPPCKVSYISFGTLSNNQHKHPTRKCISLDEIALYIKWLVDQPRHLNINELSIDAMQGDIWHE